MIRKFFDTATAEPATQIQTTNNIAELMAKHGVMNNTENSVATPISIQEQKEEPKPAEESTNAAKATETSSAEQAKSETPTPVKVEETKVEPQKEEVKVPQPTWQEVLKSQQPDTVLKELGYDDKVVTLAKKLTENPKMVSFFNHWESKGDVKDYLRELTTDYKNMPAEEVMRHQLKREYPNASQEALNVLYKREIIKSYNLDSDDETELAEGKLLLEAKADRYRDEFIKNQENYLLAAPPEPKAAEPDNTDQLVQQEIEAQKSFVASSELYKNIASAKAISFGEGEEKWNYPIPNPSELIDVFYDSEQWLNAVFDIKKENGKTIAIPKTETQLLLGLVAKHGKSFLNAYAEHFKSLGGKKAIAPIENASEVDTSGQQQGKAPEPKTPAEAMARMGTLNSGGYNR